jgi:hypothetical protein
MDDASAGRSSNGHWTAEQAFDQYPKVEARLSSATETAAGDG